jgi:hypothetical protein
VFVLVPVTLAVVMSCAIAGLNWSNVGRMLLTAVAIQAGYLLGIVTCQLMPKFSHHRGPSPENRGMRATAPPKIISKAIH